MRTSLTDSPTPEDPEGHNWATPIEAAAVVSTIPSGEQHGPPLRGAVQEELERTIRVGLFGVWPGAPACEAP